jgi:hypothetical protein
MWTISLGSICYSLIDDWIRDPLARDNYGGIRLSYRSLGVLENARAEHAAATEDIFTKDGGVG